MGGDLQLSTKISALKENLEGCRKRYDVYLDIFKTYEELSKGDYISNLVEEEKLRRRRETERYKSKSIRDY